MVASSLRHPPVPRRLVLVLNEKRSRAASDWYTALDRLVAEGSLAEYRVVPYLALLDAGAASRDVLDRVVQHARKIQANHVLWAHTHGLNVPADALSALKSIVPDFSSAYWDGDWYHWYRAPFPTETRALCAEVDVAFVCGAGDHVEHLRRHGCRDIRYTPLMTDERFPLQLPKKSYDYDLVLIGNRISSRLPFKTMPGAVLRQVLVNYFQRRLGPRFAVFGRGWTGRSAQGPIPPENQGLAYASGLAALGCNNWFARYYFSDRLPIIMSSGRPAIHYCDQGYGEVFGADPGVYWFQSPEEAWRRFRDALDDSDAAERAVTRAHELATTRLTTYHVVAYMVAVLGAYAEARASRQPVRVVENPWLARDRL